MKISTALLAVFVLLAGCGDAGDEPRSDPGPGKTEPTTTPGRPLVPGPSDNLLAFARSGGVAGVDEKLFIRPDGAARVEIEGKATRFQLTPEELDRFRSAVGAADFANLRLRYSTGGVVADGFVVEVTAGGRSVTLEQPAEPPAELGDLIALAGELIDRHR